MPSFANNAKESSTYRPTRPAKEKWLFERSLSVIDVEGSADEGAPDESDRVVAWLFCPEHPPREVPLKQVPELTANNENFVWVQVKQFTRQSLRRVADLFGLNPDCVEIALGSWRRPQLDIHERTYFLSTTIPYIDSSAYRIFASQFDLFVDSNFLISAHKQLPVLHERVIMRARQSTELIEKDASFLTYIILDELLEHYEDLREHLQEEVEIAEERAITDISEAYLEDILRLKRYAFALERLAEHHREVFGMFLRPDFPFSAPDRVEPYFQELHVRLLYLIDNLKTSAVSINSAFDIYISKVAQRTDDIVKTLAVITGLTLPISLVLFFFTALPPLWEVFGAWGVVAMLICILVVTGISMFVFYLKGWL